MKTILKEYYNLEIDHYNEYDEGIIFFINGDNYYLCKCNISNDDLNKSYELSLLLKSKGIVLHDFVFNNNNELLSNGYVLLKINSIIDDIDIYDLNKFNIEIDYDLYDDFYLLWSNKIDYLEEYISIFDNNSLISYSFDYYVGIAELLLEFYKESIKGYKGHYLVHRTFYSLNTIDYYNPLNIVLGERYKDFAAYIRITNNSDLLYVLLYKMTFEEKISLFVRLVFPFKYFNCISNDIEEDELLQIISKVDEYEDYLYKIEELLKIKLFYFIKKI